MSGMLPPGKAGVPNNCPDSIGLNNRLRLKQISSPLSTCSSTDRLSSKGECWSEMIQADGQ